VNYIHCTRSVSLGFQLHGGMPQRETYVQALVLFSPTVKLNTNQHKVINSAILRGRGGFINYLNQPPHIGKFCTPY